MAPPSANRSIEAELERTRRAQGEAADPTASVWVSANAGTGKTHVLTMRVLRLLLAGTPPERILCLTYTKAAAAEMSKRVFAELAEWVTASSEVLSDTLSKLLGRKPGAGEMARARTLFTHAVEAPGGLKVQTIHAFAERLLQRFPLEAGVPPGFAILDEETAARMKREAIDEILTRATRDRTAGLGEALTTAIAYAAEDHFDEVLSDALGYRTWLEALPRLALGDLSGLAAFEAMLKTHLGVRASASRSSIVKEQAAVLGAAEIRRVRSVLAEGTKTDAAAAATLAGALTAASESAKAEALADFFLTSTGESRKSLMTKALREANADLGSLLDRARDRFFALNRERLGADAVAATLALSRLAEAVMQSYTEAKGRRAALDFDDLISKTASLLRVSGSTQWVLYKLDGGLDHILVDESQDTSPDQWRIISALAEEFFSGRGARDEPRSLFAVGDEKQSIYSFQGAAPRMFAEMGDHFAKCAASAGIPWRRIPLNLSFRSVAPVLEAVDWVFENSSRTAGVPAGPDGIHHIAKRIGQAGLIEVWPTFAHEEAAPSDAWSPLEETTVEAPALRLANRIADTIRDWLDKGEWLSSENRRIDAGDILILVRKRNPFAAPMVAALKARGIAVAGADRIALTEQIAVEDLMALGDFLTLPEDDLALATVLKSPLFGLDDDALLTLATGRKGTLWKALLEHAKEDSRFAAPLDTLLRWRRAADFSPPYEFFATLLDKDGGRERLLARLGPDAADPLDELLNLALKYDDSEPPSLTGFLASLRASAREIKRDMEHGRNQVRVMTVHGAKGLEAPIVFLPDTCSATSASAQRGRPMKLADLPRPLHTPEPFVWPVKGASGLEPIQRAKSDIAAAGAEERDRLLYVAMTRARDRLYIAGFEGKRGREAGCWYECIETALRDRLETASLADGTAVRRMTSAQSAEPETPTSEHASVEAAAALPPWALLPVRREVQLTVPLAPSRLAPYEIDETGEPSARPAPRETLAEPAALSPGGSSDQSRFLRGTLTHALLEHLPAFDRGAWAKAAKAFVARRGHGLSQRTQASIVSETLAVLDDPALAPLFGKESRAEVPIVAVIPRPKGAGPALRLTGQIDRLAISGQTVLIIDYKTNRPPPAEPAAVADVYLYQLAAYALALEQMFPRHTVRAALLWTDGPRLMEIPIDLLNSFKSGIWDLDPARLDA